MKSISFVTALLGATVGCASVSPKPSFDEVSKLVADRGGGTIRWDQSGEADAQVKARVQKLLEGPLTPDTAVEVALLRNQSLVATYEGLGIAQADLVQAGLLRNPTVSGRLGFPSGGGAVENELGVAQDFLDLLTLPMRKTVAEAQLEAVKARVGGAVLELAAQVRGAVVALQAAQATVEVRKLTLKAQQAAAELRRRQHKAGNVGELELLQEEISFQQGTLEVARGSAPVIEARERLNRLLGLTGEDAASWKVDSLLPDPPATDPAQEQLESLAVARRLDLAALRSEAAALEEQASIAGLTRVLPSVKAGVFTSRDAEGTRVTGPTLEIELPLFDQGRGHVARLAAQVRQARARQADLVVSIRSEVRSLRGRLIAAREVVQHHRTFLLPLRERLLREAQLRYNSMLLGVFQLLLARREQSDAYRDYLDSVREYWSTRYELERASGGSLATVISAGQTK